MVTQVESEQKLFHSVMNDWSVFPSLGDNKFSSYTQFRSYVEALGNKKMKRWSTSAILGVPIYYASYKRQRSDMVTYVAWADINDSNSNMIIEELSRAVFVPSGVVLIIGTSTGISLFKVVGDMAILMSDVSVSDLLYHRNRVREVPHLKPSTDLLNNVWLMSPSSIHGYIKDKIYSRNEIRQITRGLDVSDVELIRHVLHNTLFDPTLGYFNAIRSGSSVDDEVLFSRFAGDVLDVVLSRANLKSNTKIASRLRGVISETITPLYVEYYVREQIGNFGGRLDKRIVSA